MPNDKSSGFTLLEVMVAIAIIAIALTAVLGSQSQSLSLASEAKFSTTAAFLAQGKMAEIEAEKPEDLTSDSGDFGEDFLGYRWDQSVNDVTFDEPEDVSDHLKQIDLTVSWEERDQYEYRLRLYRFFPKTQQPQ
ncbi:MAG: type II secretion system minor pseudopilin GspI [Deltaproteobacteria bacterium]|nr:type II secretion system minor pseudopilin GspI [Deltaproteobacteria bacterium]